MGGGRLIQVTSGSRRPLYLRRRRKYKKKTYPFRLQRNMSVGFPKTNAVKLRYVEHSTIQPGTGTIGTYVFRANGCFDPDFTGTGHQPNGYDQWSAFYNHYVVVSAIAKVTYQINSGESDAGGLMTGGIYLSDDATFSTNLSTILEQSQSRRGFDAFSSNTKPVTIRKGFSAKKFFNVTNITDNTERLGAPITASPSEVAFFVLYAGSANTFQDPPAVNFLVEIEYLTIFSEPKELPQS